MFLIMTTYKVPINEIEKYLVAHRDFLAEGYDKNYFVVSGPKKPRTGGVIISQLTDRAKLDDLLSNDPFVIHDLVNYEIIEFEPVKYHEKFASFVNDEFIY